MSDDLDIINFKSAAMFRRFIEIETGSPVSWDEYDDQIDLTILENWVNSYPNFFPNGLSKDTALSIICWVRYMRNSIAHKNMPWIKKYYHLYLSAAAHLVGPDFINAPDLAQEIHDFLAQLNLTALPYSAIPRN